MSSSFYQNLLAQKQRRKHPLAGIKISPPKPHLIFRLLITPFVVIVLLLSNLPTPIQAAQGSSDPPPPVQVADLFPGGGSSSPTGMTKIGTTLFFAATDGASGEELWKSGPPYETAVRVADINPGKEGSSPRNLAAIGETLFFSANDSKNGVELWKSVPPYQSAQRVADIFPGDNGSHPTNLSVLGDTLFFTADDGESGVELWKSAPPYSQASRITDIRDGRFGSHPHGLTILGWMLAVGAALAVAAAAILGHRVAPWLGMGASALIALVGLVIVTAWDGLVTAYASGAWTALFRLMLDEETQR